MSNRHTDALHYALLPDVPGMLGSTLKQVAWELCWHATDAGKCWASNQTVAEGTGLDRGTVRKAIKWLWAITLIKEIEERWTDEGDRTSNMITLRQVVDIPEGAADHKSGVKAFQGWEERVIRTDSMRFGHSAWARWTPRVGAPDTEGWVYYAPTVGALRTDGGCVQHPRWVYHAGTVGAHGTDGGCVAHPKPSYESLRLFLSENTQVKPQQQQLPGAAAEAAAVPSTSTTKSKAESERTSGAWKEEEMTSGANAPASTGLDEELKQEMAREIATLENESGSASVQELPSEGSGQGPSSEKSNVVDSVEDAACGGVSPPAPAAPPKKVARPENGSKSSRIASPEAQLLCSYLFKMINKEEPEGSAAQFRFDMLVLGGPEYCGAFLIWLGNRPSVLRRIADARDPFAYFESSMDRVKGWLYKEYTEWLNTSQAAEDHPQLLEMGREIWDPDYKPEEGKAGDAGLVAASL